MSVEIIRGDARSLPLADSCVDLVVTSPPYWSLRSYQDNGQHYDGQIGAEPSPGAFVDALIECTREWMRVLKPTGSMWINLGDKYNAYNGNRGEGTIQSNGSRQAAPKGNGLDVKDIRPKSLIGIPWRYALRCIDDLGLILRAEVIWSKPNGLPESVTDRVRRSHEQWFHMVKSPRYYSAVDEIRETYSDRVIARQRYAGRDDVPLSKDRGDRGDGNPARGILGHGHGGMSPLGKLPGSVWSVPTQPLTVPAHLGVDHFAAFPMEFPRRIISGWSPREVCTGCGEGRRPVTETTRQSGDMSERRASTRGYNGAAQGQNREAGIFAVVGYACGCPDTSARTTPGVVCDPFGGTGTTALVADALGRDGISVDMSADYCRLAAWRTSDPTEMAQARGQRLAPELRPIPGQVDMFGGAA